MGGTAALALTGASFLTSQVGAPKQNTQLSQTYQAQAADIKRRQEADAKKRKDTLAKVSAQQRARFASQGINPTDGSSAAIIAGLQQKTTDELNDKAAGYSAELQRARTSFADAQAANLEQRKSRSDLLLKDDTTLQQLKDWS